MEAGDGPSNLDESPAISPDQKLTSLEKRIATSKQHEEESLKRLAFLDERLRRLEQLDSKLSQLKTHQARSQQTLQQTVPHLPNAVELNTTEASSSPLRSLAALSSPNRPNERSHLSTVDADPLRRIVREELQSIFNQKTADDGDMFYSRGKAELAAQISAKQSTIFQDDVKPSSSQLKVAWGDSVQDAHDKLKAKIGDDAMEPASSSDVNPTPPRVLSTESTMFREQEEALKAMFAKVESRKALESLLTGNSKTDIKIKEVNSLDDAIDISLPYLFGGFTRKSPVRIKCFQMYKSVRWKAFFIAVNLANCLEITMIPEINRSEFNSQPSSTSSHNRRSGTVPSIHPTEIFEFISVFVIALEILIGSIAIGFVGDKTSWLRVSYFNKMDLVILMLAILEYYLMYSQGVLYFSFRAFRLLRLLQPLLKMKMFRDVKEILKTLSQGAGQLLTITLVLFLFYLAFAVFGMTIYQGSFRRRCVTIEHYDPVCATPLNEGEINFNIGSCTLLKGQTGSSSIDRRREQAGWELVEGGEPVVSGGYPFETFCKIYRNTSVDQYRAHYPLDPSGKYYHSCGLDSFPTLPAESTCANVENPTHGLMHFDHVGATLLAITRYSFCDAAYEVLWAALQSEPDAQPITWIFFLLLSCVITFLVLNLFLAVIANTFQEVRRGKERNKTDHDHDSDEEVTRFQEMIDTMVKRRRKQAEEDDEFDDGGALLTGWAMSFLHDQRLRHTATAVILFHVAAMCESADVSTSAFQPVVPYIYYVANAFFTAELLLRFTATGGSRNFFSNEYNILEFALVVSGLVGLATGDSVTTLLPSIRLFRLARYLPTLQDLLQDAIETIGAFLNLLLFIGLVSICFAVAGRYIFRGEMDSITRSNFGSFGQSMLTIFQILTGDSWSVVLYDAMSAKPDTGQQFYAAIFVLVWLLLSKVIFTDLFIAVLIENFEIAETVRLIAEPGRISSFRSYLQSSFQKFRDVLANVEAATEQQEEHKVINIQLTESQMQSKTASQTQLKTVSYTKQLLLKAVSAQKQFDEDNEEEKLGESDDHSLFLFGPKHSARVFCRNALKSTIFQLVIYSSIFVSCIMLMTTPPAEDVPDLQGGPFPLSIRQVCDKALTAIFLVEFVLCIIAQGFVFSKNAYLRNGWNVADFIILILSLLDLSGLVKGSIAKICRLGRALRPLRLVKRNKGLRTMMEALFATLPPLGYVIGLWMFLFIVFSIIGMGLFGGRMYRCSLGAAYPEGKRECVGAELDFDSGILLPRAWKNPPYHFDGLYQATLTLYRVNTVKFIDAMRAGMDVTRPDVSPEQNYSFLNSLYFVSYLIVSSLFVMNVFIAFIVDGFNLNRGSSAVDICYNKFVRQIESYAPRQQRFRLPKNPMSRAFRRFAESRQFKSFSLACVGCNVGFMLADHADATEGFQKLMSAQNLIFFLELVFEVTINLIAYGPGGFIDDTWKLFDFLVMLGSGFGYISQSTVLEKAAKAIRSILETMISSLPQFGNIILLLFLVYSMFATIFVQLFGLTKFGARHGPTAKFDTFPRAVVTVYQMILEDEWMMIMDDVSVQWPECTEAVDSRYIYHYAGPQYSWGDCGKSYARFVFVTFKLICQSILLNLFIGVILEKFGFITDEISHKEDPAWSSGASGSQFQKFVHTFEEFAAGTHTTSIQAASSSLLTTQHVPLGFRTHDGDLEFDDVERIAQRMIRAELNVILRLKHLSAQKMRFHWRLIYPIWQLMQQMMPRPRARFINGVTFEDVAQTYLYWRKPSLTPEAIKYARRQRIEEVLVMDAALTIVQFFRMIVAKRVHVETSTQLAPAFRLKRFQNSDVAIVRRKNHYVSVRAAEESLAAKRRIKRTKLLANESKAMAVEFSSIFNPDSHMDLHDEAVQHKIRVPRPKHGLEAFCKGAANHKVIARWVDPNNQGFVRIDMRLWDWQGWKTSHEENDSFLGPERTSPSSRETAVWTSLELVAADDAQADPWVLLDAQSFLGETTQGDARKSIVRLHVGLRSEMLQSQESREAMLAGVLEVLGYVPTDHPPEPVKPVSMRSSPRRFSPRRAASPSRGIASNRRAFL